MDSAEKAAARLKRMEELSDSHNMDACKIKDCALCKEYYDLVEAMYKDMLNIPDKR